jgi:hypothetical protein
MPGTVPLIVQKNCGLSDTRPILVMAATGSYFQKPANKIIIFLICVAEIIGPYERLLRDVVGGVNVTLEVGQR